VNRNRDRGIRAENEACRLLESLLGYPSDTIVRRKNEGIAEDIGDLWGVPDTCIQVSAVRNNPTAIADRARTKLVDCAQQQARRDLTHGVVLLRIDGCGARPTIWRALCTLDQLFALHNGRLGVYERSSELTQGDAIKGWHSPDSERDGWLHVASRRCVATVNTWADNWLHAMYPRTVA
jgi:hypothetical protein